MNDDDDDHSFRYYWEKYCPCRLHRKNIVLITLTILCFALVTWTVAATINPPNQKNASNVTYVVIDDSKPLKQINITLNSALVMVGPSHPLNLSQGWFVVNHAGVCHKKSEGDPHPEAQPVVPPADYAPGHPGAHVQMHVCRGEIKERCTN